MSELDQLKAEVRELRRRIYHLEKAVSADPVTFPLLDLLDGAGQPSFAGDDPLSGA